MDSHSIIGTKNKKGQTYTDPYHLFFEAPRIPSFFTGSEVIKEAIRRASVDLMVAYPITPQSEAAALIGELYAEGYVTDYMRGENEFGVMSECAGGSFGGARVFTTTAGPGTMRAMENFPMWSGARLPIEMIVTCRGINSPLSIQPDTLEIYFLLETGMLVWHADGAGLLRLDSHGLHGGGAARRPPADCDLLRRVLRHAHEGRREPDARRHVPAAV